MAAGCAGRRRAHAPLMGASRVWRSARQTGFDAPPVASLRADLAEAIDLQRSAWLERSRPGGLRESLARLEGTLAEYGE